VSAEGAPPLSARSGGVRACAASLAASKRALPTDCGCERDGAPDGLSEGTDVGEGKIVGMPVKKLDGVVVVGEVDDESFEELVGEPGGEL